VPVKPAAPAKKKAPAKAKKPAPKPEAPDVPDEPAPVVVQPTAPWGERLDKLLATDKDGAHKTGLDVLVARYAEQHGSWRTHTHRNSEATWELREMVWCGCPICADARVALKLEE
jgi:hypothetical protein